MKLGTRWQRWCFSDRWLFFVTSALFWASDLFRNSLGFKRVAICWEAYERPGQVRVDGGKNIAFAGTEQCVDAHVSLILTFLQRTPSQQKAEHVRSGCTAHNESTRTTSVRHGTYVDHASRWAPSGTMPVIIIPWGARPLGSASPQAFLSLLNLRICISVGAGVLKKLTILRKTNVE